MLDPVGHGVSGGAIASAMVLAVANIASPTELNSRFGSVNGALCLVTQNIAGANAWTLYAFDASSSASTVTPFIMAASGSGQWIAVAGRYCNSAVDLNGVLRAASSATIGLVVDASGASAERALVLTNSGAATKYNFKLGANDLLDNVLVLSASSVANGSTYSTVGLKMDGPTGNLTSASTVDATTKSAAGFASAGGLAAAKNIIGGQGLGLGVTSTATAAGTTTLTSASAVIQVFTGSTTQTVQFPAANIFGAGVSYIIIVKNRSSGIVTAQRAGSDTIEGATTDAVAAGATQWYASDGVSIWEKV